MGDDGPRDANERTGRVIVEATYVGGPGVLVGAGPHWVLVTDPGDEALLHEVWQSLTRASDAAHAESVVLDLLTRGFDGDPPGLAMASFGPGAVSTLARGTGRVGAEGPGRVLSLGTEGAGTAGRRLVGGVVDAARVVLRPVTATQGVPVRSPEPVAAAPAAGPGLIDGIPAAILAAKGPDGPPPSPRPRRAPQQPSDTGGLRDTAEPDPDLALRIEEGGHTTIRPRTTPQPVPGPPPVADHDGSTAHRPQHLEHQSVPTLLAVSCPAGHLSPPASPHCRVCHQRVAPQEPRRVTRPLLGGLRLPTHEVVPLDRGVVLGRKPAPLPGSTDWPHLVHLPSDHAFVSRLHLAIALDGWDVLARDLDSRGGTTLLAPGRGPERMRAGEAYVLAPGTVLDLADVYAVRFETGPFETGTPS